MNRKGILFVLVLTALLTFAVGANAQTVVKHGESYMCGDTFEVVFPDQLSTTSMVSRDPYKYLDKFYEDFYSYTIADVHAEAGKNERLLLVRIKIRNLTPTIFKGLDPDSFQLTGYVRDRSLTYTPEIMEPYDFGSYETYTYYAPEHNSWSYLPPLRMDDILLVYRVNPILINWELRVNPQATNGTSYEYGNAVYEPIEGLESCDAVFQFESIRNSETGEITKYTY